MTKSAIKEVLEGFAEMKRLNLLPKFPVEDIHSAKNSIVVTVPYEDVVPVRSAFPPARPGSRNDINNMQLSKR